jgi:hypothetical protein
MLSFQTFLGLDASTAGTARERPVVLSGADMLRHVYVVGKTGTGKTTFLENIVIDAIEAGEGVCFIDPHGDAVRRIIEHVPTWRTREVVLFDPKDADWPIAFNVIADVPAGSRARVVDGVVSALRHLWGDSWGPRLHDILYNAIYALIEGGRYSLGSIPQFLNDEDYRNRVLGQVTHPDIRAYWFDEYAQYNERYRIEVTSSTLNKVRRLLVHPAMKNIVSSRTNRLDMRAVLDEGRIILADLSKGTIGGEAMNLLGGLLIHHIHHTALARADMEEEARRPFLLVVDEFQNFGTDIFKETLAESRKYGLGLVLAHQYVRQIDDSIRDAVIGNAGSIVSFRVGSDDAEALHGELDCNATTLLELPRYTARARLLVNDDTANALTLQTVKRESRPVGNGANIRKESRRRYCASPPAHRTKKQPL